MAIRVALNHRTRYDYDRLATLGPQIIRLRPAPHCRSKIVSYSLKVLPDSHFLNWQQDPLSNYLARIVMHEPLKYFEIEVDLIVDLAPINPFDFFLEESATDYPFTYSKELQKELRPFFVKTRLTPRLSELIDSIDLSKKPSIDFLTEVNQLIYNRLDYTLRMDPGIYTPDQTLKKGVGSCRDFAWLLVHVFRRLGLAARFVSGYSIQLVADEKPIDPDAPSGVEEDICDLHAWCEVYLPGAGWVGMDPTSGLFCGEGHIPLATSADARGAAPVEGGITACKTTFDVSMSVTRIHEDPRVTKPYNEAQWKSILALGHEVDKKLFKNDVRLSMGGEPTFVSNSDQDGEEWNTGAVGPTKKPLSDKLMKRLKNKFGPGGLLHYGQGKWYPGEPLPRWEIGLYWRKDGIPIWENEALIADESIDYGYTWEDAKDLIEQITVQLNVSAEYVNTAYEDPVQFALKERKLPLNINPLENDLEDPQEREHLLRMFSTGLNNPVGYVLPLERVTWEYDGPTWHSGLWMLRGKQMYLTPGDSPLGLRLPLESLPWVHSDDNPFVHPLDPSARHQNLPSRRALIIPQHKEEDHSKRTGKKKKEEKVKPALSFEEELAQYPQNQIPETGESADWVIRTALCVEVRKGKLYVFLPPAKSIEDYIDLVTAIEHAASVIDKPVIIEGYRPPPDPRIEIFKITPDPGVMEVNIHPSYTWGELVEKTEILYNEARQLNLGTDKYQLDGTHTGTGGGNHIVVGGSTPADSPFLRRPDLLKSLIGFWINHPSLSYLFSGLFIGPTSQAPRVDEGRPDAIYEMEIAFKQIPRANEQSIPPWLTDRVFRHLLTDLTGNTHRAEFCIDKMFSPDSTTGRLGLVEFRGFEMPPHAQMSLAQQLLLRSLIVHFWEVPYEQKLTRWLTRLHDRFMLPYFVKQDFKEVIQMLHEAGISLQESWFTTHFEFRFSIIGRVEIDDVTIELRKGIEPWLVLGEEAGGGGTARYVDSSIERMQMLVTGLDLERYAIAVNGIELPLTKTEVDNTYVAGVRYRAWQPPSCLHPTIPVHAPLVFDLVDRSHSKAIGGCSYFVSHKGGRGHERFPVNALEAETRRAERFWPFGHSTGPFQMRNVIQSNEMPVTLDLRRV